MNDASNDTDRTARARAEAFIDFALACGALQLGDFTLKSGRPSPYFFDSGAFSSAAALTRLGAFYAETLVDAGLEPEVLFGPAYKGIPLAVTTSVALASEHRRDCGVAYNRKEVKDHGEGGQLVGAPLRGRIVLIDDVMTAGTAVRESLTLLDGVGAGLSGIVLALDREEGSGREREAATDDRPYARSEAARHADARNADARNAVAQLRATLGVPVVSIARFRDLVAHVRKQGDGARLAALEAHRERHGAGKGPG